MHLNDDGSYNRDYPITITKSKDNVVSALISSVDAADLAGTQGGIKLVLGGVKSSAPIEFTGMSFNAMFEYYILQNDVSYTKYPFATEGHPDRARLLAYRFRAYESVYNATIS